ncbi:hypothetical protein CAOG_01483 [Capsaspora owczarzaki ATCC 30864]|uniref:Uncharacterized protein n=1 Tax=Capsaspora owczarzaki (strain ATCC 30864) TaxID=595528 RepID=A0A0D2X138_CAPO3|nr:hypothetical protein CAOG_01483 [Capsaspora owczarzaki ATCC 30864]KJE90134.1 hypothetical protein CAOG_001483 [Capsaspora owczarzaki ATCC 30864]|eukprot:XP_004364351.1 hypothetical protein CAOG_01483 [Capsaspora owczarzaki ATCC 30864]
MADKKSRVDLKIILLGTSGAGKTSLTNRYIHDEFSNTESTIGASFALKSWKRFKLGIWDTAGQEKYAALGSFYSRNAGAAILVYDPTSKASFDELPRYVKILESAEPNCVVTLVASKSDLVESHPTLRAVSESDAREYARVHDYGYFETSSMTGKNVLPLFESIALTCLGSQMTEEERTSDARSATPSSAATTNTPANDRIRLHDAPSGAQANKAGCCS